MKTVCIVTFVMISILRASKVAYYCNGINMEILFNSRAAIWSVSQHTGHTHISCDCTYTDKNINFVFLAT